MSRTPKAKLPFSVGVDIEEVARFRREVNSSRTFLTSVFTAREMAYCMSKADPAMHFAGIFAAKESAIKALNKFRVGRLTVADFEVAHGRNGEPKVRYGGNGILIRTAQIEVSISHTAEKAVAVALSAIGY